MAVAKTEAKEALQEEHDSADKVPPEILGRRREQVTRKLKRLSPGRSAAMSATINSRGELVTETAEIAAALREHCGPIFAHTPINRTILQQRLKDERCRCLAPQLLADSFPHRGAKVVPPNPSPWQHLGC